MTMTRYCLHLFGQTMFPSDSVNWKQINSLLFMLRLVSEHRHPMHLNTLNCNWLSRQKTRAHETSPAHQIFIQIGCSFAISSSLAYYPVTSLLLFHTPSQRDQIYLIWCCFSMVPIPLALPHCNKSFFVAPRLHIKKNPYRTTTWGCKTSFLFAFSCSIAAICAASHRLPTVLRLSSEIFVNNIISHSILWCFSCDSGSCLLLHTATTSIVFRSLDVFFFQHYFCH